jgi:two-component system chemotaxis sensor kinase CheA
MSEVLKEEGLDGQRGKPAASSFSLAADVDLLIDFTLESREYIGNIESSLLTLERDPQNTEAIHSVFRGFHTIKGLAGFLELDQIQLLTHEVETLLDAVRNGRLSVNSSVVDVILQSVDYLVQALVRLEAVINGEPAVALPVDPALLDKVRQIQGAPVAEVAKAPPATVVEDFAPPEPVEHPEPVVEMPALAALESAVAKAESPKQDNAVVAPASRVKVDTQKLDALVEMVGELVIAQSLLRYDERLKMEVNAPVAHKVSHMARITSEIQQITMMMRMVPIGQLFQKTARLARDLARKTGKSVEFVTSGEDTELDRNIVEELTDPLVHMIRNSMDHGLESPEVRKAAGKNPTGKVGLRAAHQAGIIVVEIFDDGRGLDPKKIRNRAVERGLISESAEMSDEELFNLIFTPGFSTASQVTDVSGRGVGMDVVKRHIAKLRGRIEIRSVLGEGTSFLLKLPLTLAIIDGLIVAVGTERYILPIVAVKEMFRPTREMVVGMEGSREMVRLRDRVLPVVRLSKRFGVEAMRSELWESLLIVTETENHQFCLTVDELLGRQEVVIKSLGEVFRNVPGVAGGAILGDGRVGLILDPPSVFQTEAHESAIASN